MRRGLLYIYNKVSTKFPQLEPYEFSLLSPPPFIFPSRTHGSGRQNCRLAQITPHIEGRKLIDAYGKLYMLSLETDDINYQLKCVKDQFGDDHLLDIMPTHHFADAKETIEYLKAEVEKHREGAEPNDDLTMLCFTVKG